MKYAVLVALLATASASQGEPERSNQTTQYEEYGPAEKVQNLMPRRYERSANSNYVDGVHVKRTTFYSQLADDMNLIQTPDQSRAAWQETRDASRAAAAEQERFQKEHNTMVAKNYADDTLQTNTKKWHDAASRINMMNGGTTPFRTVTNARLDTKYVQLSDPLGHSDATFIPAKEAAAGVVATQQAFEASKEADVAARNAANTAEADALKQKVRAARTFQVDGEQSHNPYPAVPGYYKNVYIPEEDMYLAVETPVESYAAKAESLAAAKAAAMKQLYTMDAWQAQHAAAMDLWAHNSKSHFDQNHEEIKNTYEFD